MFVLQLLKTKKINFLFVKKKKIGFFFSVAKKNWWKKIVKTACYKSFWLCVQKTKNHDRHKYYIKFVKKIVKTRFIVWSDLWSVNRCLECIIWNYGVWKHEIFYFFSNQIAKFSVLIQEFQNICLKSLCQLPLNNLSNLARLYQCSYNWLNMGSFIKMQLWLRWLFT